MTFDLAAQYGGITMTTFCAWRNRFPEFREAIHNAEAYGAAVNLLRVRAAADAGEWRAATWLLERRYPRQYGNPDELDNSTTRSPKLDVRIVVVTSVDDDERRRLATNGYAALTDETVLDVDVQAE